MKVRSTIEILGSLCHFHLFVCASNTNFVAKLTRRHSLTPQLICKDEIWKSAGAEHPKMLALQHLFQIIMETERSETQTLWWDCPLSSVLIWTQHLKLWLRTRTLSRWRLSSLKVSPKNRAWDVETQAVVHRHQKPKRLLINMNVAGHGEAEHCQT